MKKEGGGVWVVSIDRPLVRQHFRRFPLKSIKRIWAAKQLFMCSDRIMWLPGSKIQYRSVFSRYWLDSGRCSPAILVWKLFFELILRAKDSGWCLSAIESIAGVHIVQFYQFRDVFSRYRIYHFEDFSCVHPVSIDSRKTHQKSPAHSSVFRGFFAILTYPFV